MELEPERVSCGMCFCRQRLSKGTGWVDEQRNDAGRGDKLVQQLQSLLPYLHTYRGHPGDVATWTADTGDNAKRHRIAPYMEDDRNCWGRRLGRQRPRSAFRRDNHVHLPTNQIGRERR